MLVVMLSKVRCYRLQTHKAVGSKVVVVSSSMMAMVAVVKVVNVGNFNVNYLLFAIFWFF